MTAAAPVFASPASTFPLYAVVHDDRFAASRAFAAEARLQGVKIKAIRGQVHDLWYDDLYHQWNDQPMALAGMTTHDALFLLAMMGREAGMRVVYRAHHTPGADSGKTQHVAFGPQEVLDRHPALGGPETQWGRTAARIVTAWPTAAPASRSSGSTIDQAGRHAIGGDAMVSWLMAPKSTLA